MSGGGGGCGSKQTNFECWFCFLIIFYQYEEYEKKMCSRQNRSKTEVTRKQSTRNFPKNDYFLPPDTHTYAYFLKAFYKTVPTCFHRNEEVKTFLTCDHP